MRVALVGYGGMGRHHARMTAANPEMQLVAVCDCAEAPRRQAEADYSIPTFETLDALLESVDVEGVLVVSPTGFHPEHIITAARAGKHVFSEKPLCVRPEEAPAVRKAVEEAGITFGYGLVLRYMAPYLRARQMIESGELGRVVLAHARYGGLIGHASYVFSPTLGGGLLNEHTIHQIDILDYLLGPVESVAASLSRVEGRETEDNGALLFRFRSGGAATVAASGMTRFPSRIELTGTEGEAATLWNSRLERMTPEGPEEVPLEAAPDPYAAEVEEWRLAAAEGRPPRTGLPEALRTVDLIAALHEAARTGQVVQLPRR